ncbi:MAG: methylmalonyl-CoA mutase family protein [Deltaproteobacteria bacterium]|nr:methylmalonyl-CoA mutase family protein [Deltaproteobacteria bacterium]MBW2416376.1 methylmalonyl-CoA mutase family protein [Deltaproteobacteria bacterium]
MSASVLAPATAQGSRGPVRVVTAASLFDGHDASINIMRRLLQAQGAEVIHLGHDRSVEDVVAAVVQEDADAVAISSYQGGHLEFFRYLVERLREEGAGHVRVYGGGGGTITPREVQELQAAGVTRIYRPEDGQRIGLEGMIAEMLEAGLSRPEPDDVVDSLGIADAARIAQLISFFESPPTDASRVDRLRQRLDGLRPREAAPVVGLTGTGGAGKSSLVDELVRRFRIEYPERSVAVISVDPTRRRSGGALLGDRLRMNAIRAPHVFVRSLATRRAHLALSSAVADALRVVQAADFDLVLVETAGIGQSDSEIIDRADLSVYVMTPEYGAPSQLEKIDMLDLADVVVLNKFDRRGAEDALRDVTRQRRRNRGAADGSAEPSVYPTVASRWNDPGTDRLYQAICAALADRGLGNFPKRVEPPVPQGEALRAAPLIPARRTRYLAEIADAVRGYHERSEAAAASAREADGLARALEVLGDAPPGRAEPFAAGAVADSAAPDDRLELRRRYNACLAALPGDLRADLAHWPDTRERYAADVQAYRVRGRDIPVENHVTTLSGVEVPRVALPRTGDWGDLARYFARENLPGSFPFTASVFPFKRTSEEEPARMFAGEGPPERTNLRFHLLAKDAPAVRLSTAFDSVTLYGRDPDERPDVYGKVGTSGVSVCTVDDAKKLYSGFDLLDPATSVSMTINGPAPVVLAFFFNAVVDQAVERHLEQTGQAEEVRARLAAEGVPRYAGDLPEGHDGRGLMLLGTSGDLVVDPGTYARIRAEALARVRGTVQADILKEDQAQNTCIFSTRFSLGLMGDVQEYFTRNGVENFYSVSISGYHIAEAGAFPVTQLAFTLANGFTYCEYYLDRGLSIDAFAPSLSFFFSNGLDPEYAVIGRVARRIWAIAMRERYGCSERGQRLKYHIQTSGRSLHAQEMSFNDIRTTLQALTALEDSCNSLHTNAYDEAVTTPTEESVRRALAIQLILNREFGVLKNENPAQGAYLTDELTDRVEEAVLAEFDRISERGGVLGAMETMYQRGRIQDESMRYETGKHSGELPIVGVNTFLRPGSGEEAAAPRELVRSSEDEKRGQIANLRAFHARHAAAAPEALQRLQRVARDGGNVFEELLETVKVASLGQITDALFEVGGRYRRSM